MRFDNVVINQAEIIGSEVLLVMLPEVPYRLVEALTAVGVTVFLTPVNHASLVVHYPESFGSAPITSAISNEEFVQGKIKEWRAWAEKQ